MHSVYYHRTSRGIRELFDLHSGEFKSLFSSTQQLVQTSKNKKILDLGCGGGTLVRDLRSASISIWGVDLYLDQSQKKSADFIEGDAFALPFEKQSFDLILSSYSVFHYEEPLHFRSLLLEVRRVLCSGGSLCLAVLDRPERLEYIKRVSESLGMHPDVNWKNRTCKIMKD